MTRKVLRPLPIHFASFALLLFLTPSALAIGIRPIRSEFSVKPGASVSGEITVLNETTKDFRAEPVIKVFYKNDETGFPVYPSKEELDEEGLADFSEWIDLPKEPVLVPAGGSASVKYTVKVPLDAEAGGKYATVAYQPVKESRPGVAVSVRAASLLFVNVEGDVVREGEISRFSLPENLRTDQPFQFEVSFQNTGNTHLKPSGWIEIVDRKTGKALKEIASYVDPETGGEKIGDRIPVNLRQKNVLPGSLRTFQGEWGKGVKEGEFEAILSLSYDPAKAPLIRKFEFSLQEEVTAEDFRINIGEASADFDLTLANQGLATEKVTGSLKILNGFGYVVSEIPLPEGAGAIAPGETVMLNLPWISSAVPAGRYTAKLEASYGFSKKALESQIGFGRRDKAKLLMGAAIIALAGLSLWPLLKKKKKGRG